MTMPLPSSAPTFVFTALSFGRHRPLAAALEVLDLAMVGRRGDAFDPGAGWAAPGSPLGTLLAAAFDRDMTPHEWARLTSDRADPSLVHLLLGRWSRLVLRPFAERYGLCMMAS